MLTRFSIHRWDELCSCSLGCYGVCRWLLWQLQSDFFVVMRVLCSSFLEAGMNSGKEVRRSFHPSLHFPANFYHTPSPSFIIPPLTAPSHLLSTFHITLSPCVPFQPSSVCLGIFLSLPFLFSLPFHIPLIFHFLTCLAVYLSLSLLCLSVGFCFPLSLSLFLCLHCFLMLPHP